MIQAGDSKRYLYYKVLSATGEKEALATIVEGLNKGNGAAKDAALDALLAWKGIEAADELFKVCQSASSDQVFDRALKRYVQLVSNPAFTRENRLLSLRKVMEIARTSEQKALILRQIQRADTFLALMYASEFLASSDAAVRSAAVYAVWNIARNHPEYKGDNVKAILKRVLTMFDGEDARYDIDALKQHLDAMPDEVGFVSIFNGKDLTGWKGLVENPIARAKMKPAQLAKAQEKADQVKLGPSPVIVQETENKVLESLNKFEEIRTKLLSTSNHDHIPCFDHLSRRRRKLDHHAIDG
jgi:hypothetical protein